MTPCVPQRKRVLCLDVAFRHLGCAVYDLKLRRFVFSQVFSTARNAHLSVADDNALLIGRMTQWLDAIIRRFRPELVLTELPVGSSRSSRAASQMALAFATVVSCLTLNDCRWQRIKPSDIKKVTGCTSRVVPKEVVIAYVKRRFKPNPALFPKQDSLVEHAADAMACLAAYWAFYERGENPQV